MVKSLKWRHFTRGDGDSKKCWSITSGVDFVAIKTGGEEGQAQRTRTRMFPNEDTVKTWFEEQIAKKIENGYIEIGGKATPKVTRSKKQPRKSEVESPVGVAWHRIDSWLSAHSKVSGALLPNGVSSSEVKSTEQAIKAEFPAQLRTSYLLHNGSGKIGFSFGSFRFGRVLTIGEIANSWKAFQNSRDLHESLVANPDGPIQRVWYSAYWIPLITNDQGEFGLVDLKPLRNGKKGQLIEFSRGDGPRRVISRDFAEFLDCVASDLEAGRYELDEKTWALHDTEH